MIYAKDNEKNDDYQNYITIVLPSNEFQIYGDLRKKRRFKASIARFLQASLIMPALVEGISKLRMEDREEADEEDDGRYHGTIWADSICEMLRKNHGIEDLNDCQYSDYELANKLLGNVELESLNNLLKKTQEWSTIRQEDDIL